MKTFKRTFAVILALTPLTGFSAVIEPEFEDMENFTDFSVYGMNEERTLRIFLGEMESQFERWAKRYLKEGEKLVLTFTDIDMAGDIQPWRNRVSADIRYVESIYPPRLRFRYAHVAADGEILREGEEHLTDMAFQMNTGAVIRGRYEHFFYESELLDRWMRKTLRK